jgi:hypothetical protein
VTGIADQEYQSLTMGLHPRVDAIAEHPAIASQTFESRRQRGARSEGVLDEVQRSAAATRLHERQCLRRL